MILSHSSHCLLYSSHLPATTEIYTLSLHDALPICCVPSNQASLLKLPQDVCVSIAALLWLALNPLTIFTQPQVLKRLLIDRKSTRLNSSHGYISYAVFCLKKKKHNGRPPYYSKQFQ